MEAVRTSKHVGSLDGAPVFVMSRRPEPALLFRNLNYRTLEFVRRNDPRRYKNIQDMIDRLDLDDKHGRHGRGPAAHLLKA